MIDGTYEEKLDEIVMYLYEAFLDSHSHIVKNGESLTNVELACKHDTEILGHLQEKFTRLNYDIGGFLDRLHTDNYIMIVSFKGGDAHKVYKLSPQGVDLVNSGDSYVKMAKRKKDKIDLELNLLRSQIESNKLTKLTNTYVAAFTGLGGLYALLQILITVIPENVNHRKLIIYCIIVFAAGTGIYGYLRIAQTKSKQ